MPKPPNQPSLPFTESPVYWFVTLEQAIARGDFAGAIRAQSELERLGVRVRYGRPRRPRGGPGHAA